MSEEGGTMPKKALQLLFNPFRSPEFWECNAWGGVHAVRDLTCKTGQGCVIGSTLKSDLTWIGWHCTQARIGVIWSDFLLHVQTLAAAFGAIWRLLVLCRGRPENKALQQSSLDETEGMNQDLWVRRGQRRPNFSYVARFLWGTPGRTGGV